MTFWQVYLVATLVFAGLILIWAARQHSWWLYALVVMVATIHIVLSMAGLAGIIERNGIPVP